MQAGSSSSGVESVDLRMALGWGRKRRRAEQPILSNSGAEQELAAAAAAAAQPKLVKRTVNAEDRHVDKHGDRTLSPL